jgi:hypothetical protein
MFIKSRPVSANTTAATFKKSSSSFQNEKLQKYQ